jgi:hypothetical protein
MYSSCLWRNWDWIDQPSFTFISVRKNFQN